MANPFDKLVPANDTQPTPNPWIDLDMFPPWNPPKPTDDKKFPPPSKLGGPPVPANDNPVRTPANDNPPNYDNDNQRPTPPIPFPSPMKLGGPMPDPSVPPGRQRLEATVGKVITVADVPEQDPWETDTKVVIEPRGPGGLKGTTHDGMDPWETDSPTVIQRKDGPSPIGIPELEGVPGSYKQFSQGLNENVGPALQGFYAQAANLLALPVESLNSVMGKAGMNFLEKPGDAAAALKRAFNQIGIRTKEGQLEGLREQMGAEAFNAMMMYFALRAAAPKLANTPAGPNMGIGERIGRAIADTFQSKPVTAAVSTATQVPGTVLGAEFGGYAGEAVGGAVGGETGKKYGRAVGQTLGATVGGTITGGVGTGLANRTGFIPLNEQPKFAVRPNAIVEPTAMTDAPQTFALDQVRRQVQMIDRGIESAVNKIRSNLRPNQSAEDAVVQLRQSLNDAFERARAVETYMWNRIPKNTPIDVTPIQQAGNRIARYADVNPNEVPGTELNILNRWIDENGNVMTLGRLLRYRSGVQQAARESQGGGGTGRAANYALHRNLVALDTAILNEIERQMPGNVSVSQAREVSRVLHDRYTRGPVGDVLRLDWQGQPRVSAEDTLNELLAQRQGPNNVAALNDPLSPSVPQTAQHTTSLNAETKRVQQNMDAALKMDFEKRIREGAEAVALRQPGGPDPNTPWEPNLRTTAITKETQKLERQYGPMLNRFVSAGARLEAAARDTNRWLQERVQWERSALAQYAKGPPENAVRGVYNAPNPTEVAKQLRAQFNNDPDALAGFQRGIIEELFKRGKGRPQATKAIMDTPKYRSLLKQTLDPDQMGRLDKIVDDAIALEGKNAGFTATERAARGVVSFMARIMGLHAGRVLSNVLGGGSAGSLSLPAKFARDFQARVAGMFDDGAPETLMTAAVMDPRVERALRLSVPDRPGSAEAATATFRTVNKYLQAGMEASRRSLFENPNAAYRERDRDRQHRLNVLLTQPNSVDGELTPIEASIPPPGPVPRGP